MIHVIVHCRYTTPVTRDISHVFDKDEDEEQADNEAAGSAGGDIGSESWLCSTKKAQVTKNTIIKKFQM